MFKMEEEGHYTIKRVNKLPKKGNANWLYTIKGSSINKFYRWKGIDEGYETILVGEEGVNKIEAGENVTILGTGSLADPYIINALDNFEPTDLSTDYGIDLSPVAISNDYNDLDNTPIFKVVENEYENLSEMYADQANQTNTFIQYVKDVSRPPDIFSGDGYFEYLGTTIGNLEDYRILSEEEAAPISTSVTRTSELLNDGQDGINPFTTSQDLPTSTQQLINEGADGTDTYVEFKDLPTSTQQLINEGADGTDTYVEFKDLPTSTQQLINEGADGTDTYVEFKDLPTVAKEGLSVQDTNGTEQFKVDDFIKFKGVVFDGAEKQVSITSLRFNTIFLSTTGDDGNFEENSKLRPARTLDAVWDYLYTQPEKGFGWTIYILSSGTFTLTRYNQALKGFNIYNETGATISIESYFNVTDQWIFNFPKGKLRFRRTDDSQLLGTFKNSLTLSVKHDIDEVEFVNDSTGELSLGRQAIRTLCVNSSFNYINWKTLTIQQGGWNIFDALLGDKVKVKIDTLINNTTVHGGFPTFAVHNLELGTYINNTTINHRIDAKVGTIKEVISNSAFVGIRINNLMLTEDLYLTNAFLDVSQAGYNVLEGNGYQINVNTNLSSRDIFSSHIGISGKDTAFGYSRTIANYIKNVRFNVEAGSLTPRFTRADLRADVRIGNQFILENVEVNSTDPLILLEIQNHFGNFADYQMIFRGVCKILNKTHLLVSGISGIVSQDLLVSENATIIHDFGQISSNSNIQTNIPNKGIQTSDDIREGNTNKFAKLNGTEISIGDTNVTELKIGETLVIDKDQIVTGAEGFLVTKKIGGKTVVEVESEIKDAEFFNNYEDIPLKEGQYILNNGLAAFSNSYNTDVYDAITGENILVKNIPIGGSKPYILRKIFQNVNSFSYFTDELYDGGDVFVGYIYGSPNRNNFRLELTKDYFFFRFKGNYRFAIAPNEIYTLSFKNEIYTDNNSVKGINAYNNLPFSQKNISVTVNGEDATGAVKVGLLSRNSTISEDFIAFEPNGYWTKERLQGADVIITFERDKAPARIPTLSKENFTGVNVAVAENENGHGLKMQEVFGNSYGNFTANFANGIPGNPDNVGYANLTNEKYIQDTLISVNADIIFGATNSNGGGFNSSIFLNYPAEVFKVFPNGANTLVRDDNGFDNITQFITNGVLVTSRADNDLDGSDPKGTSYGFGVEFNEPTLEADMLAGGYNWTGASFSEHQQSPATAIVAGKLKFIKDETGAPWYLVRQAARKTASHANNYNIYTGFGVIDKAAAITWLNTKDWEAGNKKYALEDSVAPLNLTNSQEYIPAGWNTAKLHFSGGLVTLTGLLRLPNGTTNSQLSLFTIPPKYRPNRSALNMCLTSTSNIVRLDITPSGFGTLRILQGQPQMPANSWVSLNGCSYMLDGSLIE